MVSDNGPQFRSGEFALFLKSNGINQLCSPPYHPESNGLAERGVQTVKRSLKSYFLSCKEQKLSIQDIVLNFLFKYRNTPCTVTGVCPSEVVLAYKPITLLSYCKIKNDVEVKVTKYKLRKIAEKNDFINNEKCKHFDLKEGEKILYLNPNQSNTAKWIEGFIRKRLSKSLYLIEVNQRRFSAHRNQIKPFKKDMIELSENSKLDSDCSEGEEFFDAQNSPVEECVPKDELPLKNRLRKKENVNYKF